MKKFFFLNASDRAVLATLVTILAIALMVVFFSSCTKNDDDPESAPQPRLTVHVDADTIQTHATVTFSCLGFELQPFTRSLEADGK
jgi:hypothetical protein